MVMVTLALTGPSVRAQDEADQLRRIEIDRLRSLVDGDLTTARRLHADDYQLISPSGAALSRDQYLAQLASGELDYILLKPGPLQIRRYGDAAVLRYQVEGQATFAGQQTPLRRFWHTDVYEKRNGRWLAVWSQGTLIQ